MDKDIEIFDSSDLVRILKSDRFKSRVDRIIEENLDVEAYFHIRKAVGFDSFIYNQVRTGSKTSIIATPEFPERELRTNDDHYLLPEIKNRKRIKTYPVIGLHSHPNGSPVPSLADLETKGYYVSGLCADSINLILTIKDNEPYITIHENVEKEVHDKLNDKEIGKEFFKNIASQGIQLKTGQYITEMDLVEEQIDLAINQTLSKYGVKGRYFALSTPEDKLHEILNGFSVYGDKKHLIYENIRVPTVNAQAPI